MSSFKTLLQEILFPFESFHKHFLRVSCVHGIIIGQEGKGERSAGKPERLLLHVKDVGSILKEHNLGRQ